MLKRIALTVTFLTVTTFTIGTPAAAHTGTGKDAKVNTSTKASGICPMGLRC